MAIFHMHVKTFSRAKGQSAVAAAAYRSAETLIDERQERIHAYAGRRGHVYSEIIAPVHAPQWAYDRETLWNEVERSETRINSRVAREVEVALPRELDMDTNIEMIREYIYRNYVFQGMVADFSIHNHLAADGGTNPHAHILLTTRDISRNGFEGKNRSWNSTANLQMWREAWADQLNETLEGEGLDVQVDHRILEAQGIDRVPGVHLGKESTHMEAKGIVTERGDRKREVMAHNIVQELYKGSEQEFMQQDIEELSIREQMREWIGTRIERAQGWWQERVGRWQERRAQEYER